MNTKHSNITVRTNLNTKTAHEWTNEIVQAESGRTACIIVKDKAERIALIRALLQPGDLDTLCGVGG